MYNIGVDLGGTNIAVGIVDENHKIIRKGSVPTNAGRTADDIVKDIAALCEKLTGEEGLSLDDIASVGIATPGTALRDVGVVAYANNLPFRDYPIAERLQSFFPVKKVIIANDADAAALGECAAGAGKGFNDFIMVTLGTGVGGGIIVNGKLYSGSNFAGGELGHMVIEHGGVQCSCGRKGCWEAYSSATAIIRMTKEKMAECKDSVMWDYAEGKLENVNGRTAFDCMRKGDKAATEVVETYISYLATGTANILNIFQPSVMAFGGGIANEKDNLIIPLTKAVEAEMYGGKLKTALKSATLGNDAGIIGAAALLKMS